MDDVQPGKRPIFDFDGSLNVAAAMWSLAASLTAGGKARHCGWDSALEVWRGSVGDLVRGLIEDDKTDVGSVCQVLEVEACQWAKVWAETVDETNRVLAAEAREILKSHRAKADEGFQLHDLDDPFDKGEKEYSQAFDVPAAAPVGVPQAPSFTQPRNPFANYELSGDNMFINGYLVAVPPY